MMAENVSNLQLRLQDEAIANKAYEDWYMWKIGDVEVQPCGSPFSSCSTTLPYSPSGSMDMLATPQSSPVASRCAAEDPKLMSKDRQTSWAEENFGGERACLTKSFFDDDDSDDDDILPGKPLWSYSGPSLEELLAAEAMTSDQQDKRQPTEEEDDVEDGGPSASAVERA